MLQAFATKLAEVFASKALIRYYQQAVTESITNQDYEGEIRDKASVLNILTFDKILSHDYTGSALVADTLNESNAQLVTNQQKAFYFKIQSLSKFKSYIKNPEGTILDQTANELKKVIDTYVLGLYTKVQAGNRIGVNYTTGTVTVTTVTGAVVGSGTTFTSAMVGRGFQAAGQTSWYRVATFTDSTHITIVDDLDDTGTGAYTGGSVSGGTAYTIEAVSPVQLTRSNAYDYFNQLALALDNYEIPEDNRWATVSPAIFAVIKEAPEYIPSGSDVARTQVVENGKVGNLAGFTIHKSARVAGDNVNGFHCIAGHKSAITFAMGFVENGIEDLIGDFGKAYKSLNVYGAKVPDERRKALTELFAYK